MIRVPIEPNRVGFAATTDARFQAADYSGTGLQALGHGLEQLGEAGERFAQVQQQVQDNFNDAGTKSIDGDTTVERLTLLSDYQNKKGYEAEQAFPLVQQALAEITKRSEARATTKTMREMLAHVNAERDRLAHADFLKHYQEQSQVAAVASAGARRDVSVEAAVRAVDPLDREKNVATGEGEVRTLGQLRGDPPEVVENDVRKYHSGVLFAIGRKLALAGDLDAAAAHLDQHAPELLDADELKLREMLAEPLRQRDVEAHVDRRMGAATRTGDAPFSYSNPLHGAGRAPVVDASSQGIAMPAAAGTPVFASGPGIARVGQDETGSNILSIDHGNGRTTRYLALGQLAVSDGDTVTPDTPIGRVGDGGTGTPHLRYEIIANGTPVAPDAVLAEVRQSPRRLNLDAVLADIDHDPSLDNEMREDAKDAVRRRAKLGNDLADREEDAARTRVYDIIDTLPDQRLTTTAQIPPHLWADLMEADRTRLKSDIRANNSGGQIPGNGAVVADLNQLILTDPVKFLQQDLRMSRDKMAPREFDSLISLQEQLRTNPAAPKVIAHKRIWARIASEGPALGVDSARTAQPAAREQAQQLYARMALALEGDTAGKRLPTDNEISSSFGNEVLMVTAPELGAVFKVTPEETPTHSSYSYISGANGKSESLPLSRGLVDKDDFIMSEDALNTNRLRRGFRIEDYNRVIKAQQGRSLIFRSFLIQGGRYEDRLAAVRYIKAVLSTQRGKFFENEAAKSERQERVIVDRHFEYYATGDYNLGILRFNPSTINELALPTTKGWKDQQAVVIFGHELGHIFSRIRDVGPNRMDNVILNENPIRLELGYPARIDYGRYEIKKRGPGRPGLYGEVYNKVTGKYYYGRLGDVPPITHGK